MKVRGFWAVRAVIGKLFFGVWGNWTVFLEGGNFVTRFLIFVLIGILFLMFLLLMGIFLSFMILKRDFFLTEKKIMAVIDCFRFFGRDVVSSLFFGNGVFLFLEEKGFRKIKSLRAHDDEVVFVDFFDNEKFLVSEGKDHVENLRFWTLFKEES